MKLLSTILGLILFFNGFSQSNTETRKTEDFSKIKVSGAFEVALKKGDKTEIIITGEPEVISKIETIVKNGTLSIKPEKGFKKYNSIPVEIMYTSVNSINLFGSGEFKSDVITAEEFSFTSRGSGDQKLAVQATTLTVSTSGSGDLFISGTAENAKIKSFGSGKIHGFELNATNIVLESKGSGDIDLNASGSITGESFGSGDVECKGGGEVNITSQGSGTVRTR